MLLFYFLILFSFGFAQERLHKVVYAEALGFTFLYSLNFEFDFKDSSMTNFVSYRTGLSYSNFNSDKIGVLTYGVALQYNIYLKRRLFLVASILPVLLLNTSKNFIPINGNSNTNSYYPRGYIDTEVSLKWCPTEEQRVFIKACLGFQIFDYSYNSEFKMIESNFQPYLGIGIGYGF